MPLSRFATFARRVAVWLFWPAVVLVVWGELSPRDKTLEPHVWDKLLHFTAYFGLAGIATVALRANRWTIAALVALIAVGGALEIIQGMVGRDADIYDELANTLGVLSGGAIGWAIVRLHGKLVGPSPRD